MGAYSRLDADIVPSIGADRMAKEAIFRSALLHRRVAYSPLGTTRPFVFVSAQLAPGLTTETLPRETIDSTFSIGLEPIRSDHADGPTDREHVCLRRPTPISPSPAASIAKGTGSGTAVMCEPAK